MNDRTKQRKKWREKEENLRPEIRFYFPFIVLLVTRIDSRHTRIFFLFSLFLILYICSIGRNVIKVRTHRENLCTDCLGVCARVCMCICVEQSAVEILMPKMSRRRILFKRRINDSSKLCWNVFSDLVERVAILNSIQAIWKLNWYQSQLAIRWISHSTMLLMWFIFKSPKGGQCEHRW